MPSRAALVRRVRAAFPDLAFDRAALIEAGADHLVLVLDQRLVFWFPRRRRHPTGLARELAVLAALAPLCEVSIPHYAYVAADGAFAGYAMIEGVELTPDRFAALGAGARDRVLGQIAGFLSAMHGLTLEAVGPGLSLDDWPRDGRPADYAADGRRRHLGPIAAAFPDLAEPVQAFLARLATRAPGPVRLLHGDVTADHLLLAPGGDRLAGVIDFGDTEAGDPAHDFAYLWRYGPAAFAGVWRDYVYRAEDPGLPERSLWGYGRYCVEALAETLLAGGDGAAAAAALPAILAAVYDGGSGV